MCEKLHTTLLDDHHSRVYMSISGIFNAAQKHPCAETHISGNVQSRENYVDATQHKKSGQYSTLNEKPPKPNNPKKKKTNSVVRSIAALIGFPDFFIS